MTGRELRTQLRVQQACNRRATGAIETEAEVASTERCATPKQAAELRRLVGIVAADWPPDEQTEALAVALADPEAALTSFRALVADLQPAPPTVVADDGMRSCRQCTNLSPGGRCLAAWRGEPFGDGIAVRRDFAPLDPDRPQRCLPYRPGPSDHDRRPGAERWPWLNTPGTTSG